MDTTEVTLIDLLREFITQHDGCKCVGVLEKSLVVASYYANGVARIEAIPATKRSVKDWLGY